MQIPCRYSQDQSSGIYRFFLEVVDKAMTWAYIADVARFAVYHSYSPVALWKTYSLPFTVKTPSFKVHFLLNY